MADLLFVPGVVAISLVALVVVVFVTALWKLSAVPLNAGGDAACPDGVDGKGLTPSAVGLPWVEVIVKSDLGFNPCWVVPSGDSRTWAIMIHGRGGGRESWLETLPLLYDAGVTTMSITHRGDDDAPQVPHDYLGTQEWLDVEYAVMEAERQGATKVLLFARSAGASVAMQFLRNSRWSWLVTDMVLDDPVLDWRSVFMNCRPEWMPRVAANLILAVAQFRIKAKLDRLDFARYPPVARPRTLILHGLDDRVVPHASSVRFHDSLKAEWSLVLVPTKGDHGETRVTDPDWHDMLIKTWLGHEPEPA